MNRSNLVYHLKETLQGHMTKKDYQNIAVDDLMDDFMGVIDAELREDDRTANEYRNKASIISVDNEELRKQLMEKTCRCEELECELKALKCKLTAEYSDSIIGTLQRKLRNRDKVIGRLKKVVDALIEAEDE